MKNTYCKRIMALILCLFTLLFSCVVLSSCDNEDPTGTDAVTDAETEKPESPISVLRFTKSLSKGDKISSDIVEIVNRLPSEVPEGAMTVTLEELKSETYYSTTEIAPGDYLVSGKVSKEKPKTNTSTLSTQWITNQANKDYLVAIAKGNDQSDELQKLIDDNPGRTIYFSDGVYKLSKPLVIPMAPEKRVSLRLSQYAVITVMDAAKWTAGDPLLHFGKGETADEASIDAVGARIYLTGGTLSCQKVADGVKVEGSGNLLISHIAIKNFANGVHIATNNVDIDNITGTGNVTKDSIGILVEGSHNTLTNLRICQEYYGIKLTKGGNILRNLHPLIGAMANDPGTVGFLDTSDGNFYDYCYSDQHATNFVLADKNTSVLSNCYGYWWSANNGKHWGIHATGRFNSVAYGTRIDMCHADSVDNAFLVVDKEGGKGKLVYCTHSTSNDDYAKYYKQYVKN